jgi:hypothetical protein
MDGFLVPAGKGCTTWGSNIVWQPIGPGPVASGNRLAAAALSALSAPLCHAYFDKMRLSLQYSTDAPSPFYGMDEKQH